ncbi:MAG TPA: hypothetical protein VJS15_02335 [Allosphingosinicella sp.]|nr:hypothetical protein [Allosphingosinicella sp.]
MGRAPARSLKTHPRLKGGRSSVGSGAIQGAPPNIASGGGGGSDLMSDIGGLKSSMSQLQWGLSLLLPVLIGVLYWIANGSTSRFDRLDDRIHAISQETAKHGAEISALKERTARPAEGGGR